jgi:lysophospholipase L1-like esterase
MPAFPTGSRILFQGDSITDGNRRRTADPNHILGHGYAFLIAARFGAALPDRHMTFLNRGVSVEEYEERYNQLLAETVKALPNVRLVLCEAVCPAVGSYKDEHWEERLAELRKRQAVVAQLAVRYHAALVHFQKAFDTACERAPADYWIWDGIHPTYSGHQIMAAEWVRTVGRLAEAVLAGWHKPPMPSKRPSKAFGRVDVLVNETNLFGVVNVTMAAITVMCSNSDTEIRFGTAHRLRTLISDGRVWK